ncbi:MAG: hypothetical protein QHH07_01430 [Sedimentisphaerales bacterium]|nr:hypothetical protein [Sedimentisphaerales bacterium]
MRRTIISICLPALLVGLVFAVTSGQVRPVGKKIGMVQFDAVLQMNMDRSKATTTVFARYWVGQDLYALAVSWSEPNGRGFLRLRNEVMLSDSQGFTLYNDRFPGSPNNKTYQRPLGDRPPFEWIGGLYHTRDTRFADSAAMARRVYVGDLGPLLDPGQEGTGTFEIQIPRSTERPEKKGVLGQ